MRDRFCKRCCLAMPSHNTITLRAIMCKSLCSAMLLLTIMVVSGHAFAPPQRITRSSGTRLSVTSKEKDDAAFVERLREAGKSEVPYVFTGGAFDDMDAKAVQLACRINGVKSLGWTQPSRRRGDARPRHRAYGGQTEKPIQLKPNYNITSSNRVEPWLTQEDFYMYVKEDSPAADTVFVALAGGAAFAEREIVEQKLAEWRSGGKFNEAAFLKSVQQGRLELGLGWAIFLSLNVIIVSSLLVPTNPIAQGLEAAVGQFKDILRPPETL